MDTAPGITYLEFFTSIHFGKVPSFRVLLKAAAIKDHRMDVLKLLLSIWFIQGRE